MPLIVHEVPDGKPRVPERTGGVRGDNGGAGPPDNGGAGQDAGNEL